MNIKFGISIRSVVLVIVVLILAGIFIGYEMYNKPHRSVESEQAIAVTANELFQSFEADEQHSNELYLNKTLLVTGKISEITKNQDGNTVVILETTNPMFGVSCTLEHESKQVMPQTQVSIKGICTGYLSDVIITRGIFEKTKE